MSNNTSLCPLPAGGRTGGDNKGRLSKHVNFFLFLHQLFC